MLGNTFSLFTFLHTLFGQFCWVLNLQFEASIIIKIDFFVVKIFSFYLFTIFFLFKTRVTFFPKKITTDFLFYERRFFLQKPAPSRILTRSSTRGSLNGIKDTWSCMNAWGHFSYHHVWVMIRQHRSETIVLSEHYRLWGV